MAKPEIKKKKKFTVINVLQIITLLALLAYMQIAVDTGKISKIFIASPTMIIEEAVEIITDHTLLPHLILTLEEVLVGYGLAALVGITVALIWTLICAVVRFLQCHFTLFCHL